MDDSQIGCYTRRVISSAFDNLKTSVILIVNYLPSVEQHIGLLYSSVRSDFLRNRIWNMEFIENETDSMLCMSVCLNIPNIRP